jgi:DNA invertase Pin-like site-specific DNA recombinase
MPQAAAIYTRISDDRTGSHLGVTRQREDCEALAQRLGWPASDYYEDNDLSAYSGKPRPEYRRMLDDFRSGRIDAILAWHPDRLYRSPRDLEELIDLIDTRGALIQTVSAGTVDLATPTGRAVARTIGAWARFESEHKSERIRRQQAQLAFSGRPAGGGKRPFGYEGDRMTLKPDEAAVIREMKDRILAGDSVRSIATDLNARGCRTVTGGEWYPSCIRDLLLRPRYSGQREYKGEVVAQAAWPAVFSPADAAQLSALFSDPRRRTVRTPRRYLLSGALLRCSRCQAPLVARPLAGGARRYCCAKGPALPGCGGTFIAALRVETLISDAVLHRLSSPKLATALASHADDPATAQGRQAIDEDQALLDHLAAALGRKEIGLREWQSARGPIIQRLALNRELLNRQSRTRAIDELLASPQGIRAAYEQMTLSQQRAVVAAVLDHATIGPGVSGRNHFDPSRVSPTWGV